MQFPGCNEGLAPSYRYAAALKRLHDAIGTADYGNIVIRELTNLPPRDANLFKIVGNAEGRYERDRYSTSLINTYTGPRGSAYSAASVDAHGSYLFNSVSLLICGSPRLSTELLLRTCLELTSRRFQYLSYPLANLFNSLSSDFDEAVADCAKHDGYSCMWTVLALSTVIRRRIVSFYPRLNGPVDPFADMADMVINPLDGYHLVEGQECVSILWTRTQPHIGQHPQLTRIMSHPHYKLTYFNGRGRAEIIRLVLAAADVPFEDVRIEISDFSKLKPTLPFQQVPIFEIDGKIRVCQSLSIARHLAHKYDLAGKTEIDKLQVDMIVDCQNDSLDPVKLFFRLEPDPEKKAALKKKYIEEQLPVFLTMLEALLVANNGGNGYFVGDGLTWADLHFLRIQGALELQVGLSTEAAFKNFPKLAALFDRLTKLPKLAAYIAKRPVTQF